MTSILVPFLRASRMSFSLFTHHNLAMNMASNGSRSRKPSFTLFFTRSFKLKKVKPRYINMLMIITCHRLLPSFGSIILILSFLDVRSCTCICLLSPSGLIVSGKVPLPNSCTFSSSNSISLTTFVLLLSNFLKLPALPFSWILLVRLVTSDASKLLMTCSRLKDLHLA